MKKLLLIPLLATAVFAQQKILIPLYSYPNWYDTSYEWKKIPPSSDTYAIINPQNGPSTKMSENYKRGIEDLNKNKINVIGYVYTGYGKRPLTSVKADINVYSTKFKGLKGIFFDETSTDPKKIAYYRNLANYAKSKGLSFVVLNPGITTDKTYVNSGIADLIVSYEESEENWKNNFPKTSNAETRKTKLGVLLHDAKGANLKTNLELAKQRGFSFVYFTDDNDDNTWDNLSTYINKY